MNLEQRINVFAVLGDRIKSDPNIEEVIRSAKIHNAWFSVKNIQLALDAIVIEMLDPVRLQRWLNAYDLKHVSSKTIALVLAGNIPAVGFFDILCVLILGHKAKIKLSSKDTVLIKYLLQTLMDIEPYFKQKIEYVDRVKDFDAVIATGSNNTSVYFQHYFGKYPHIIRKNRKSIGVLYEDYTTEEVRAMSNDIFAHFGLGCRNISKVLIHESIKREDLMEVWHEQKEVVLHNKYKNNFDYNYTIFLLNQADFLMSGSLLLLNDSSIHSRIATLHCETFNDEVDLHQKIVSDIEDIQCIVSSRVMNNSEIPFPIIAPGDSQHPTLTDYADHIDTIQFLSQLL